MSDISREDNIKIHSEIVRETAALSITLYFSQALYMVRGFVIAHILGPSAYGIWTVFRTVFNSAPFLGFGTQEAMVREVPFSIGEGNKEKTPVIIQTTLSWNILVATCVMIIAFILSFAPFIKEYNSELRLAGIVFVINAIHLFMQPRFKSERKIILLSKYLLSYAILNFIFGLTFLFFLEIHGLLLGMIISQLILFVFLISKGYLSMDLLLDRNVLRKLLSIGFPIMIISLLFFLMRNIDKFIVIAFLGKKSAGYYGLAAFISNVVRYVSYSTSSVLLPRVMHTYGKTRNIKDLGMYFTTPMVILSGFIPVLLGIMYINIGSVVNLFLPKYLPAVSVIQILILGLFFTSIWGLPTNILIALNKQKFFMYITAGVLLFTILLDIIAIQIGFGMIGVAVCTTFMFLVASVIANSLALLLFENSTKQIWWKLGLIYFPFVYSFAGLIIIVSVQISPNVIIDNLIKTIIFLIVSIPIIFYTERKSNIISKVFSIAKNLKR